MPDEMISITKAEYKRLQNSARFLEVLYEVGVDNWAGYEEAQAICERG